LSKRRDVKSAKCLLRRAIREHGDPLSITLDAYAASHRAIEKLKEEGEIHYEKINRENDSDENTPNGLIFY
jgi:transposase-like protein